MEGWVEQHVEKMDGLERAMGYAFKERSLLVRALTHRSFSNERPDLGMPNNESLEFLGDAVLNFLVSDHLYAKYAFFSEGDMTRARSGMVNAEHLYSVALDIGLGEHVLLGKGEARTGGRGKPGILADALEAVIAAVYLDGGVRVVRSLVKRLLKGAFAELKPDQPPVADHKSKLQQDLSSYGHPPAEYVTEGEEGPDHSKTFFVRVSVGGETWGRGEGRSKKAAQQAAASDALGRVVQGSGFEAGRREEGESPL